MNDRLASLSIRAAPFLLAISRPVPPSSSSPSGDLSDGTLSQNGPGEEQPSTHLEDPDFPYAGVTWTEIGLLGGICVFLALLMFLNTLSSPCCAPDTQAEMFRAGGRILLNVLSWGLYALPIFWACVRLRPHSLGWGRVIGGHLLLAFGISFVATLGYDLANTAMVILWPPSDPPDSLALAPLEVLTELEFVGALVPYFMLFVVGVGRFQYLRSRARQERARRLKREAEQLRSQLTAARLESLRMQINPHFFHNTLHTISTMAGRDPEGIRTATARLSDLMRYVLSTSDQQEVPLEEELDVLESYLDIQKLRLDDRLEVHMDIAPATRTALVPTLLLQPLVENAVKHGFEGADEVGHLHIRAARDDDTLVLEVVDNGKGLSDTTVNPSEIENGAPLRDGEDSHGLDNIVERLDGLYGDTASLQFERSSGGGLRVVVRIPFRPRESDRNLRTSGIVAD